MARALLAYAVSVIIDSLSEFGELLGTLQHNTVRGGLSPPIRTPITMYFIHNSQIR